MTRDGFRRVCRTNLSLSRADQRRRVCFASGAFRAISFVGSEVDRERVDLASSASSASFLSVERGFRITEQGSDRRIPRKRQLRVRCRRFHPQLGPDLFSASGLKT